MFNLLKEYLTKYLIKGVILFLRVLLSVTLSSAPTQSFTKTLSDLTHNIDSIILSCCVAVLSVLLEYITPDLPTSFLNQEKKLWGNRKCIDEILCKTKVKDIDIISVAYVESPYFFSYYDYYDHVVVVSKGALGLSENVKKFLIIQALMRWKVRKGNQSTFKEWFLRNIRDIFEIFFSIYLISLFVIATVNIDYIWIVLILSVLLSIGIGIFTYRTLATYYYEANSLLSENMGLEYVISCLCKLKKEMSKEKNVVWYEIRQFLLFSIPPIKWQLSKLCVTRK